MCGAHLARVLPLFGIVGPTRATARKKATLSDKVNAVHTLVYNIVITYRIC